MFHPRPLLELSSLRCVFPRARPAAAKQPLRARELAASTLWSLNPTLQQGACLGRDLSKGGIFLMSHVFQWDLFGAGTKLILLKSMQGQKIIPSPAQFGMGAQPR